jgi:hypothetical protein
MHWQYNPDLRQWETIVHGWRGIVARWSSGAEWTAAIESLTEPDQRDQAGHVFLWVEDAQGWCAAKLEQLDAHG